ncbi:MAG TPA: hypothetical protein VF070_24930 [Streptosporangiaceae bacterium]
MQEWAQVQQPPGSAERPRRESACTIGLADGSKHATGYWAEEVLVPYERFVNAGADLVIAAPDGRPPQPDPWGLEPFFRYPQDDEDFMFSVFRSFAPNADDIRVTFSAQLPA